MSNIYQIKAQVPVISVVPLRSEAPDEATYRVQVEAFLQQLKPLSIGLNNATQEINWAIKWIDNSLTEVGRYVNLTANYKNEAFAYKEEAVKAVNSVKGYVIPTNATYSKDEIDKYFDEVARVQVAQQLMLAFK